MSDFTLRVTGSLQPKKGEQKYAKLIDIYLNVNGSESMHRIDQRVLNSMKIKHSDHVDYEIMYEVKERSLPLRGQETVATYFQDFDTSEGSTLSVTAMCYCKEYASDYRQSFAPRVAKSTATIWNNLCVEADRKAKSKDRYQRMKKRQKLENAQKLKDQAGGPKKKVRVKPPKKEIDSQGKGDDDMSDDDLPLKEAIAFIDSLSYKDVEKDIIGTETGMKGSKSRLVKTLKGMNSKAEAYDFVINRFAEISLDKGVKGKTCRKMFRESMKIHQKELIAEHCLTSIQRGAYNFIPITYGQYWEEHGRELGHRQDDSPDEDEETGMFVVQFSRELEGYRYEAKLDEFKFALMDEKEVTDFIKKVFEGCSDAARKHMFSGAFFATSYGPWFWNLVYHASFPQDVWGEDYDETLGEYVFVTNKKMTYIELMKKMVPELDWDSIVPNSISKRSKTID